MDVFTKPVISLDDLASDVEASRSQVRESATVIKELQGEIAAIRGARELPPATDYANHAYVSVGERSTIDPDVRVMAQDEAHRVTIGDGARICRDTEIIGPITLGKRSFINRGGFVQSNVVIGTSVAIGPFVRLITDNHEIGLPTRRAGQVHTLPIVIGDGVWIGGSVTIIGGVAVGDGAIIGAGSVVTKDVAPNCIVAGVPARVIRELPVPAGPRGRRRAAAPGQPDAC